MAASSEDELQALVAELEGALEIAQTEWAWYQDAFESSQQESEEKLTSAWEDIHRLKHGRFATQAQLDVFLYEEDLRAKKVAAWFAEYDRKKSLDAELPCLLELRKILGT